jgi:hypothetical protein
MLSRLPAAENTYIPNSVPLIPQADVSTCRLQSSVETKFATQGAKPPAEGAPSEKQGETGSEHAIISTAKYEPEPINTQGLVTEKLKPSSDRVQVPTYLTNW